MKKWICFCFALLFIAGCKKEVPEIKVAESVYELDKIFEEKDKFIIEISKQGCFYCSELDKVENKFKGNKDIYKYVIDDMTKDKDIKYLENKFVPFKYIPAFYSIEDEEIVDYLIIQDWDNPLREVNQWIMKQ